MLIIASSVWASHLYAQIETGISYNAKDNTVSLQINNASDSTVLGFLEEPMGEYSVSMQDWPGMKKEYPSDFRVKTTQKIYDGKYTLEPRETTSCTNAAPADGQSFVVKYDLMRLHLYNYTKDAKTGMWDRKGPYIGFRNIFLQETFVQTPHYTIPEGRLLTSITIDPKHKKLLLRLRNVSDSIVYQINKEYPRSDFDMAENRYFVEYDSARIKKETTCGVIFKLQKRSDQLMLGPGEEELVELPLSYLCRMITSKYLIHYNKWVKPSASASFRFIGTGNVVSHNGFIIRQK